MIVPNPDDLTDAHLAAIVRAQDEASVRIAEITARDPSLRGIQNSLDEHREAVEPVTAPFVAAGLDRERAAAAVTVWLIERLDPAACVRAADETGWKRPGERPPGALGLSTSDRSCGTGRAGLCTTHQTAPCLGRSVTGADRPGRTTDPTTPRDRRPRPFFSQNDSPSRSPRP